MRKIAVYPTGTWKYGFLFENCLNLKTIWRVFENKNPYFAGRQDL